MTTKPATRTKSPPVATRNTTPPAEGDNSTAAMADAVSKGLKALAAIENADGDGIAARLAYGKALNDLRSLCADDRAFGRLVKKTQLDKRLVAGKTSGGTVEVTRNERSACMWAAASPEDLAKMQACYPGVGSVRGWHERWKASTKPPKPAPVPAPLPSEGMKPMRFVLSPSQMAVSVLDCAPDPDDRESLTTYVHAVIEQLQKVIGDDTAGKEAA